MPRYARLPATRYAALALTDTFLVWQANPRVRRLRYLTKPLLMPALASAFTRVAPPRTGRMRQGTLGAQAFSWGGDVALLGQGERSFLAGVGSFSAAHASYIAGFVSAREHGPNRETKGVKAAAATWVALVPVMVVMAGKKDPAMRLPIAGYATILCAMFASSTTLDRQLPSPARRRVVAGTSLFLLSDGLLGLQKFVLTTPSRNLEAAVMATYTAGQWLIASGVCAAENAPLHAGGSPSA